MGYRISYADGQVFQVELANQEAVEWFIRIDFPDATFVGGGGQITAWMNAEACRNGADPVAVVERSGTSTGQPS